MMHRRACQAAGCRGLAGRRGSMFLLWTLTFSTTILVMVVGYFPMFQAAVATSARSFRAEQALALADTAAQLGIWEVATRNGGDFPNVKPDQSQNTPIWVDYNFSADLAACANLDGGNDNQLYGTTVYSCFRGDTVVVNAQDNFGGQVGGYDTYIVNFGLKEVTVVGLGWLTGPTDTAVNQRTIAVRLENKAFTDDGLFSQWGLRFDGSAPSFVDSYHSSAGPYNPASPGSEGHIGTNGDNPNGWEADIIIGNANTVINGRANSTPGDNHVSAALPPTGGWNTVPDIEVPRVFVNSTLTSLPLTTSLVGGTGVITNGQGDFQITGTYTCSAPLRVHSLYINDGTFIIADGCQVFIDGKNADGTNHDPAYKPGGAALDADASGKFLKTGTGTTQIFLRDARFALDGKGIGYDASVAEANRIPEHLQLYTSCTTKGACDTTSSLAQTLPFYGVVHVEDGHLQIVRGSEWGWSYDEHYYGQFIAEKFIFVTSENRNQTGTPDDYSVFLHVDRDVRVWPDGSGRTGYHVKPGSWSIKH